MDQKELIKLQGRYKLTEEEYQQYYHAVNVFFTTGKHAEEKPKLVFVAGQAGAGKSRLIPVANKKLDYNAVVIDYDVIRSMHPKFELASKENNENIHLALLPDSDRANQELRDYCRENKLNLIYEGTMRATEGFIRMAREFKNSGYEIGLELMAVPKFESYTSTFFRYAMQLANDTTPRWVPKSVHDSSCENFIITLQRFESEGLFDYATVYKRGDKDPEPFYSTSRTTNENYEVMPIYNFEELETPSEAVVYGMEEFEKEALKKFNSEYEIIYGVFSEYEPELLPYVEDLQIMYAEELQVVYTEEDKEQSKKDLEGEDRDD